MSIPVLLPLSIKLHAAANERDLHRYTMQSIRAFEQSVFAKACEKSAAASSQDAESREEFNSCRYLDGPLLSEVSEAMAAGLQDHVIECERLEEAVDR